MTEEMLLKNTGRFVLMIGDVVAICWNAKEVKKAVVADGASYYASTWEKAGKPYIDFVGFGMDRREEYYEKEDSPVDGGIDAEFGKQIANELLLAAAWLESNQ